jgi:hypothetical protein
MRRLSLLLPLTLVAALAACSSDASDDSADGGGSITAADGGMPIEMPSGDGGMTTVPPRPIEKYAVVTSTVNFRDQPNLDTSKVLRMLPRRDLVILRGAVMNGFFPAEHEGVKGFVSEKFLFPLDGRRVPCDMIDGNTPEYDADACHRKVYAPDEKRTLSCPIVSTDGAGYAPSGAPIVVDGNAFKTLVPNDLLTAAVLIRRVGGVPVYKYLSNGTHDTATQPWSSSKFMAAATAGANLRRKSGGAVGLSSTTADPSKGDRLPLGDLITEVESYEERRYTSNGTARYFLNVGGRAYAQQMITTWLKRPSSETYGGNYGFPAPDLGYTFREQGGAQVTITPDETAGPANHLSMLTMAEYLKRLALWDDKATRMDYLTQEDLQVLFYGPANGSVLYPTDVGGMTADITMYVQQALVMDDVLNKSQGRFRQFSKLGFGGNQYVDVSYMCIPELDGAGNPIPDRGAEFVIATKFDSGKAYHLGDQDLALHYRKLIQTGILPRTQYR